MDSHCLIFPIYTMGTQLGQPDVEDIMALCLTERRGTEKTKEDTQELKKRTRRKQYVYVYFR